MVKLSYTCVGPAVNSSDYKDTLLFLHGWPDHADLWQKQVSHFSSRGYLCVAVHGLNTGVLQQRFGADFPEIIDAVHDIIQDKTVSNGSVVVVGHDWGAMYTYLLMAKYPEDVKKMATIDVGGHTASAFLIAQLPLLGETIGNAMTRIAAKYLHAPFIGEWTTAYINFPYFYFWKWMIFRGAGGLTGMKKLQLNKPILYCYGKRKPFSFHSPKWLAMVNNAPQSKAIEFDSGHWVQVSRAKEFNQALENFLNASEK